MYGCVREYGLLLLLALPVIWSKNNVGFLRIKISENLWGRDQTIKKASSCLTFLTTFLKALDHGPPVLR